MKLCYLYRVMQENKRGKKHVIIVNFWGKGGLRHYSDALVELMHHDHDVLYVNNYNNPPKKGWRHCRVSLNLNLLALMNYFSVCRLIYKLNKNRGPILFTSDHPFLLLVYPFLIFKRTALIVHDPLTHEGERNRKSFFNWLHLNFFTIFLSRFIIHSSKLREDLPWAIKIRPIFVVPHIDYIFNDPSDDQPCAIEDRPFRLLFFGRILAYKGLDFLLEAMQKLPEECFHLTVAGEGKITSSSDFNNITMFNRFVSDKKMHMLFAECHAVVLPYISATQSGVIHMALAHQKPVISTSVGAIPDVIQDGKNGFLVEPGSESALRKAINKISQPAIYNHLCEQISKNQSHNFSLVKSRLNKALWGQSSLVNVNET